MTDDVLGRRPCKHCGAPIPTGRGKNATYCSSLHQQKAATERNKEKYRAASEVGARPEDWRAHIGRSGGLLESIKGALTGNEYVDWLQGRMLDANVAKIVSASESGVYRAKVAGRAEHKIEVAAADWVMHSDHVAMLGPSDEEMRSLVEGGEDETFLKLLDEAIRSFAQFRDAWFEYRPGHPFITRKFHLDWMTEVLRTIYTGGRTMILSPPRHGKSELLVHFSVWLILRNPDIRILWIGPSDDIARNMLGKVRDILEEHTELRDAFLGPGEVWKPEGKAGGWSQTRFTVANRSAHAKRNIKQPTMWCTGVQGRIHSLDCDFIVVDDPEDPTNTATPLQREKTKDWFRIKVATRKMFWTGLVIISSRVHVDDLYSMYLDSELWNIRIDRAHDQSLCGHDIEDEHAFSECVLFPEINPGQYLLEQLETVGRPLFEMMYLNQPRPEGTLIFDPDIIRDRCLDWERDLGLPVDMGSYRLVAGLDPASRGVQAAFLWAVTDSGRSLMVDLEAQKAGGVEGAIRVMNAWEEKYGNNLWLVEDNSYQNTFWDHGGVKALKARGFTIEPTHTGMNKHDPDFGVAAMERFYNDGIIRLPYGSPAAKRKTDMLIRELTLFTDDTTKQRRRKSDILMAHWFPWSRVIKRWLQGDRPPRAKRAHGSYPNLHGFNLGERAPWATNYPGVNR